MPPTRLPTATDFPTALNPTFHPPSANPTTISNIILFLPGLGDTSTNFSSFPRALSLPDTQSLTLQPPFPLPFGLTSTPSYHWSDDLQISTAGDLDGTESGFDTSVNMLATAVADVLIAKCKFRAEEIHLFGFGQGGSLALLVALGVRARIGGSGLGSVVSIGGPLPVNMPSSASASVSPTDAIGSERCRTPVLILGGTRGAVFGGDGESMLKRARERFEVVETARWKKVDDGMPRNREEVLPLMRFWGRRLRSRRGVPEGAVEVS